MNFPFLSRVSASWHEIPESWRIELASAVHTFVGAFLFQVAFQLHPILAAGQLPTTKEALIALGLAVTRSAWKNAWVAIQPWIAERIERWKTRKSS